MVASRKKLPPSLRDDLTVNYVWVPRPRRVRPTLATQKPAAKKSKSK